MRRSIEALPALHPIEHRLELHIVTEEKALPALQHLQIIAKVHGVPSEFKTIRVKYKARALEWFRRVQNISSTDWILHLDEETFLDSHAIRSAVDAVGKDPTMLLAQEMILYNAHDYWANKVIAYADMKRVLDAFGRYQFQWNYCVVRSSVYMTHSR
jgi:DICT domain-containing protein